MWEPCLLYSIGCLSSTSSSSYSLEINFQLFSRDNLCSFVMFSIRYAWRYLREAPSSRFETQQFDKLSRKGGRSLLCCCTRATLVEREASPRNFQQNRWKRLFHSIFFSNLERFDTLQLSGSTRWFLVFEEGWFLF